MTSTKIVILFITSVMLNTKVSASEAGGIPARVAALEEMVANMKCESGEVTMTGSSTTVTFTKPFDKIPALVHGFYQLDASKNRNLRVISTVEHLDETSVVFRVQKWGDTILYTAKITWMACPSRD